VLVRSRASYQSLPAGLELGEDIMKAKPIPDDLAVLMVRWIETGQEPTPDELGALPSRSRTPRGGPSAASEVGPS
jgi:hypothetical protein